jgi:HSP20 family protein
VTGAYIAPVTGVEGGCAMLEKLTQWNPLRNVQKNGKHRGTGLKELGRLQESMNRLFDGFFDGRGFFRDRYTESEEAFWYPSMDVSETDTAIIVRAELPGMTKKDVDISLQDNVLTVQGEKKRKKKTKHENFYRVERSFGHFCQSFTLPAAVEQDKVKATFAHGVLSITLPKTESAKPRRIAITPANE